MVGAILIGIAAGYIGWRVMPSRAIPGLLVTSFLGVGGSVVGFLFFTEVLEIGHDERFDLGGLIGATSGAMILLAVYRLLLGDDDQPLAP